MELKIYTEEEDRVQLMYSIIKIIGLGGIFFQIPQELLNIMEIKDIDGFNPERVGSYNVFNPDNPAYPWKMDPERVSLNIFLSFNKQQYTTGGATNNDGNTGTKIMEH